MQLDYETRLINAFRNMRPDDVDFFVILAETYAADYAKERPKLRLVRSGVSVPSLAGSSLPGEASGT